MVSNFWRWSLLVPTCFTTPQRKKTDMQTIPVGTKVWVSTSAPRAIGPVVRDAQYVGTVLRQNPYESTHYPVRLDIDNSIRIVSDSMLSPVNK